MTLDMKKKKGDISLDWEYGKSFSEITVVKQT